MRSTNNWDTATFEQIKHCWETDNGDTEREQKRRRKLQSARKIYDYNYDTNNNRKKLKDTFLNSLS